MSELNLDERILAALGVESEENYVDNKAKAMIPDIKQLIRDVLEEVKPARMEGAVNRDTSIHNAVIGELEANAKELGL